MRLQIDVFDNQKIVAVWLTKAERDDERVREKLRELRAESALRDCTGSDLTFAQEQEVILASCSYYAAIAFDLITPTARKGLGESQTFSLYSNAPACSGTFVNGLPGGARFNGVAHYMHVYVGQLRADGRA